VGQETDHVLIRSRIIHLVPGQVFDDERHQAQVVAQDVHRAKDPGDVSIEILEISIIGMPEHDVPRLGGKILRANGLAIETHDFDG
jgi:hypothetical protein